MEDKPFAEDRDSAFPRTQWTVIREALSSDSERARNALETLCANYHRPILNWFRRTAPEEEAKDLAQSFVVYLLQKDLLAKVAKESGRFRCYLAACMRKFRSDQQEKESALKRGGGAERVPLFDDVVDAQSQSPGDSTYDLDVALTIHERVMSALAPSQELTAYIFWKESSEPWDRIASRLGITPAAARQQASRLRRKHWEEFSKEVSQISTPLEHADETRYLYQLLFKHLT